MVNDGQNMFGTEFLEKRKNGKAKERWRMDVKDAEAKMKLTLGTNILTRKPTFWKVRKVFKIG